MQASLRFLSIIALACLIATAGNPWLGPSPHPVRANPASFTLYGRIQSPAGWGPTSSSVASPGPTLTVLPGEVVRMLINSGDGFTHNWGVDYNGNGVIDSGEPISNNTSTSTPYQFTATTIPGQYTYWCFIHKGAMHGTFIVQSPDFSITANPTSIGPIGNGISSMSTITISPINGFTGTVTLTTSPSPELNAMLTPNSITGGSGTSTLTVSASMPGAYNVNVTGTSGMTTHHVTVVVNVVGPDFTLAANPPTVGPLNQATLGTSTITVTPSNMFTGAVSLTVTSTPSTGLTATLNPTSIPGGNGTSTLTVSGSASGSYHVSVTGTRGSLVHSLALIVYVGADFSISISGLPFSITQGSSSTGTLTLTSLNGFSGNINLAAIVSPSGPLVTFNPTVVMLTAGTSGQSMVQIAASSGTYSSTPVGTYTVNITMTGSSVSHSSAIVVTVKAPSSTTGLPTSIIVGIAVAIVAAVGVTMFAVRRSRGKK